MALVVVHPQAARGQIGTHAGEPPSDFEPVLPTLAIDPLEHPEGGHVPIRKVGKDAAQRTVRHPRLHDDMLDSCTRSRLQLRFCRREAGKRQAGQTRVTDAGCAKRAAERHRRIDQTL